MRALLDHLDLWITLLGLGWYLRLRILQAWRRFATPQAQRAPRVEAVPAPAPTPAPAPAAAVDYATLWQRTTQRSSQALTWLATINEQPDHHPHTAIVGPTGSGKSTLCLAVLRQRVGRLVIATPKNAIDDPWGGFPCARLSFSAAGVDWRQIDAAVALVYEEWLLRNADADRAREPLTLVVDEYVTTVDKLPAIKPRVLDLWAMGRSVGIRVITLGTEFNVKAWGIEGRGDIRSNLLIVQCRADRGATLGRWQGETQEIDTRLVPELAQGGLDVARAWLPVSGIPVSDAGIPDMDAEYRAPKGGGIPDTIKRAAELARTTDLSANEIFRQVGGNRNDVLAIIRIVRGE